MESVMGRAGRSAPDLAQLLEHLELGSGARELGERLGLLELVDLALQRFLSQPFNVAKVFTGQDGKIVSLKDTIRGFKGILEGQYDHLPEQAFYMVGSIDEAVEKAKTLQ